MIKEMNKLVTALEQTLEENQRKVTMLELELDELKNKHKKKEIKIRRDFAVGDYVEWLGVEGIVEKVYTDDHNGYPVIAIFNRNRYIFTRDGKLLQDHNEPSLILKRRKIPLKMEYQYKFNEAPEYFKLPNDFRYTNFKLTLEEII